MSTDTEPSQARRTQADRTAGTQTKLLDAAIDCLVEVGFAKTSTQEIARRAGVSRGAQLHHFPSKESLLTAAVGHLMEKRLEELLAADVPRDQGLQILLDAFSGPLFYAALELWVAARTDAALHDAMLPLERRVAEAIQLGTVEILGGRMTSEAIELSIELARGLAVSALFRTPQSEAELRTRLIPVWEALVMS